jgi:hypothetical protein
MTYIRVQLIRKLADRLDGVDVTPYAVGQAIDLSAHAAAVLISEGWARPVQAASPLDAVSASPPRRQADGRTGPKTRAQGSRA